MGKKMESLNRMKLVRRVRQQNHERNNASVQSAATPAFIMFTSQYDVGMWAMDRQIEQLEKEAEKERIEEMQQAVIANVSKELSNESGKVATEIAKEIEKILRIKTK